MHQKLDGKNVYVVDFDTMPELPIHGLTEAEAVFEKLLDRVGGYFRSNRRYTGDYAKALDDAIRTGVITEPGKYAIHLVRKTNSYEIFRVIED